VHAPPCRETCAAAGIFVGHEDNQNRGKCVPNNGERSQYAAEIFAALEAIRSVNKDTALTIISTQDYILDAMNKKLTRWEHEGWVGVQHREVLRCLAAEIKARRAPTIFKTAEPGSPDRKMCGQAAKLAKRAARDRMNEAWDLTLPQDTALPGCKEIVRRFSIVAYAKRR
jgi:hypothetical protein